MQSTSVHNVECNECVKIIYGVGVRHKCLTCPDFDLCSRCFRKAAVIHPAHKFNVVGPTSTFSENSSDNQDSRQGPEADGTEPENGHGIKDPCWEQLDLMDYPFSEDETVQDAFRKVIVADANLIHLSGDIENKSEMERSLQEFLFEGFWSRQVEDLPDLAHKQNYSLEMLFLACKQLTKGHVSDFVAQLVFILSQKRLFVSSKRYIGWGPKAMMPGDKIVVLFGARMPVVLRKIPSQLPSTCSNNNYTLVRECYTHGLMKGEALENLDVNVQKFLIH